MDALDALDEFNVRERIEAQPNYEEVQTTPNGSFQGFNLFGRFDLKDSKLFEAEWSKLL